MNMEMKEKTIMYQQMSQGMNIKIAESVNMVHVHWIFKSSRDNDLAYDNSEQQ